MGLLRDLLGNFQFFLLVPIYRFLVHILGKVGH